MPSKISLLDTLGPLGWDAAWAASAHERDAGSTETVAARIIAEHRISYQATGADGTAWCEATGRAFHQATDKRDLPTVGDWVLLERWAESRGGAGNAVVREILPRRNLLVRRAAGEASVPQPMAANLDLGLVMTSANGDLSAPRLDRYLNLLRDAGIPAVVVLSKIDLVPDPAPVIAEIEANAPGVRVIAISLVSATGLDALRALVQPRATAVLLGSSGVGKSSLLNMLLGTQQATREIRDDDKGRHTTTRRELFVAGDGSLWIDTPGMRELGRWARDDDDDEEEDAFDDIAELAEGCKFRDCRHEAEPGCAVRGVVGPDRLASFHKLADEHTTAAADQKTARRIAETQHAKAKRYVTRPGKPGDER
ncbi:MAG: ribosome small subunit-dependent GTPase A [Kofleriaceae bacterium]